jgi:hypothetical protein
MIGDWIRRLLMRWWKYRFHISTIRTPDKRSYVLRGRK